MKRPRDCVTVEQVERELDGALRDLRRLDQVEPSNLHARAAAEYRVGALRTRQRQLEGR